MNHTLSIIFTVSVEICAAHRGKTQQLQLPMSATLMPYMHLNHNTYNRPPHSASGGGVLTGKVVDEVRCIRHACHVAVLVRLGQVGSQLPLQQCWVVCIALVDLTQCHVVTRCHRLTRCHRRRRHLLLFLTGTRRQLYHTVHHAQHVLRMLTGAIKFTKNLDFLREIKIVKFIEKVTNTMRENGRSLKDLACLSWLRQNMWVEKPLQLKVCKSKLAHWHRQGGSPGPQWPAQKFFLLKQRDFQVSRDLTSSPQT